MEHTEHFLNTYTYFETLYAVYDECPLKISSSLLDTCPGPPFQKMKLTTLLIDDWMNDLLSH